MGLDRRCRDAARGYVTGTPGHAHCFEVSAGRTQDVRIYDGYLTLDDAIDALRVADQIIFEPEGEVATGVSFVQALRRLYDIRNVGQRRFLVRFDTSTGGRIAHLFVPAIERAAG